MILRKYEELMDRIQVTDSMRSRILNNIRAAGPEPVPQRPALRLYRRALAAAACFALLVTGVFFFFPLQSPPVEGFPSPSLSNPVGDITEAASAEELSRLVGFEVSDLEGLPFPVEEKTYTSHWNQLAEIQYTGQDQTAVYRKAPAAEDISGRYDVFDSTIEQTVRHTTVLFKGNSGQYNLANWTEGDYSHSLYLSQGIPLEDFTQLISQLLP